MSGRAAKQSYLGRVIGPAKYHEGQNNSKPFLSFAVFVDRLAVKAENKRERISGKIFCSYSVQSEEDPVAFILCNVLDSKTGSGSINGHTYKTVEVWIEGNEKLAEVKAFDDKGQPLSGAYYKSLEFCSVQILDKNLVKLLRPGAGGETDSESAAPPSQANVAPSSRPVVKAAEQPAEQPAAQNRKVYAVGDRVTDKGETYEFLGGDQSSMSNWTVVDLSAAPAEKTPPTPPPTAKPPGVGNPFGKAANGGSTIRSMLAEDGNSDGPSFGGTSRPPV